MKLDGLTHPKTKQLAYTLGVQLPHAIGLLELMWAFVSHQTPRGNIGKWPNSVIAGEAGWHLDADTFVNALIECGFLDVCKTHRLVVHDWKDHVPNWVRAKLKKSGQAFLSADLSSDLSKPLEAALEASITATTSLAKPGEDKTEEEKDIGAVAPKRPKFSLPSIQEVRDYCIERGRIVDPDRWFDYYTANGWKVGKNPMKDWKAAVRTWEKNSGGGNGQNQRTNKLSIAEQATEERKRGERILAEREAYDGIMGADDPYLRPPLDGDFRKVSG